MQQVNAPPFLRETVVVIPALNEVECIAVTVKQWLGLGAARVRVSDNGSSDGTAEVARRAGAEVVREPLRGYGAAAWRALQNWPEEMTWVLFSSADGSDRLLPEETDEWQKAVDRGVELVLGDRLALPASRIHLKPAQRFGNWLTCRAIRAGWGRRFQDLGSLRLVRQTSLRQLGLEDRGFGWNVEMQVKAVERGWKIAEIPVLYLPRTAGESKISGSILGTVRAGHGILRMLAQLWRLHQSKSQAAVPPRFGRGDE